MTTAAATATTAITGGKFLTLGHIRMVVMDMPIVSGDTLATAAPAGLSTVVYAILVADVKQTAVPTYSTNVATFTFADPAATVKGQVILFGT